MVVTLGQQYNVIVVHARIQRVAAEETTVTQQVSHLSNANPARGHECTVLTMLKFNHAQTFVNGWSKVSTVLFCTGSMYSVYSTLPILLCCTVQCTTACCTVQHRVGVAVEFPR